MFFMSGMKGIKLAVASLRSASATPSSLGSLEIGFVMGQRHRTIALAVQTSAGDEHR
jgi:hypothetical protein